MTSVEHSGRQSGPITLHIETQAADVQVVSDPRITGSLVELSTPDSSGPAVDAIRSASFQDHGSEIRLKLVEGVSGELSREAMASEPGNGEYVAVRAHVDWIDAVTVYRRDDCLESAGFRWQQVGGSRRLRSWKDLCLMGDVAPLGAFVHRAREVSKWWVTSAEDSGLFHGEELLPTDPQAVREWAAAEGLPISAKGRIQNHVLLAFQEAHGLTGSTGNVSERQALADRFFAKVDTSGPCWEWIAALDARGYGVFGISRTAGASPVHRLSWELLVGEIPAGKELDHLCRWPRCVNPDHLEVVSAEENYRRSYITGSMNARKTRCKNGHDFDREYRRSDGRRLRYCSRCPRPRGITSPRVAV